jgi:hypothetical protein
MLVHNECDGFWKKALSYTGSINKVLPIDHIWAGHSWENRAINASKTVFSADMTK